MAQRKPEDAPEKPEKKSIHAGHRERLRERLRSAGLAAFSEHEVLELLLTYAIPQRDVNPLAHELIARFGSLNSVLEADEAELVRVPGVGRHAALMLTLMPQLMRYVQMNAMGSRPVIRNYAQAKAYCMPLFRGAKQEHVYLICLNQSGQVLHPALLHTGTIDEVALYPRLVVETALRHHAHAVLLAHNHPGGTAYASEADRRTTLRIAAVLAQIGIRLVDHLIVAGGGVYSMTREDGMDGGEAEDMSYIAERAKGHGGALRDEQYEWLTLGARDAEWLK